MITKSLTRAVEIKILRATTSWILNVSHLFNNLTIGLTFRLMIIWSIAFTASALIAFLVTLLLFQQ